MTIKEEERTVIITIKPVDGFVKAIFEHLQARIKELEDENARLHKAIFERIDNDQNS